MSRGASAGPAPIVGIVPPENTVIDDGTYCYKSVTPREAVARLRPNALRAVGFALEDDVPGLMEYLRRDLGLTSQDPVWSAVVAAPLGRNHVLLEPGEAVLVYDPVDAGTGEGKVFRIVTRMA